MCTENVSCKIIDDFRVSKCFESVKIIGHQNQVVTKYNNSAGIFVLTPP